MKPNEKFGAQIVFTLFALVLFITGSIAYTKGVEHGYDGKKPYSIDYSAKSDYNINDYLIDSKILEGGIEDGKYENNSTKLIKDGRDTRKANKTSTESDKRSKQKFKENIQYLGRFFQNSWYISTAIFRNNYFYGN